jgi:tripartite-type tricarboxylate transporter receptor subunit TctC
MKRIACMNALAALAFGAAGLATSASAQDFYKGRTIRIVVGSGTGGFDFHARMLARFMGRHIPGSPAVVVQNMAGGGGLVAGNYVYNVAEHDGLTLGNVNSNLASEEALGAPEVRYETDKFNWIGRVSSAYNLAIAWSTTGIETIDDVKKREVSLATTGASSPISVLPIVLNRMVGTKFKLIYGYTDTAAAMLAMERQETEASASSLNSLKVERRDWVRDNKINILVQYAPDRHPELKDVPNLVELVTSEADKKVMALFASSAFVGRAFMTTPGVAADRVKILRDAFDATMKDADFIEELRKTNAEFDPMPGAELQAFLKKTMEVTPEVLERARWAKTND